MKFIDELLFMVAAVVVLLLVFWPIKVEKTK